VPTFTDEHGIAVTYYVWPAENARAVLQLAHGVGEHALRYGPLVERLNAAGYTVYADDHRGHGQTGMAQWNGDASKLGRLGPGGLRATVDDVREVTRIIHRENSGLPVVLLGHSWGSLMAQMIVNDHAEDYDALVLTGTAYRVLGSMNSGDLNKRHKHLGTTGVEWLSRDPAVHEAFVADPLTVDAKVAKLFGVLDALRLFGRPARNLGRDLPLLIMVGSDDPLGGPRSARRLAAAYVNRSGLSDVTVRVYDGARHEIFNEFNKDEVVDELVAWLGERVPRA
jgi:alpha-beta hydrolase superfamily lysophospholipase